MADKILLSNLEETLRFPSREEYLNALIQTYKNISEEGAYGNLGNLDLYEPLRIGLPK
jgi:hypothetical protein